MEVVIATSLGLAARFGQRDELRRLLDAGHHVRNVDNRGYTALHEAAEAGHEDCCELLLQEDQCDPNAKTYEGYTPLFLACRHQEKASLIALLVRFGGDCNVANNQNVSPLHVASMGNKVGLIRELLNHGADISSQEWDGCTPLHRAVDNNRIAAVRELLKHGANPDIDDDRRVTPLYLACQFGLKEIVESLIQFGASVNKSTEDGMTPLMAACQIPAHLEIVELLLQHGADPDVENDARQLALSFSVRSSSAEIVKSVLKRTSRDVIIKNSSLAPEYLVSLPCLAIDAEYLQTLKVVMESDLDDSVKNAPMLTCYLSPVSVVPYNQVSPLGFLLADYPYRDSMVDVVLSQGSTVNASSLYEMPPLVALVYARCPFHLKEVNFRKLLRNGCDIDSCAAPPGSSYNSGLPVAVLAACSYQNISYPGSTSMLRLLFESSVACDADEILAWVRQHEENAYELVFNVLRDHVIKRQPSRGHVCSLQAITRCAVRRWLWNTLRDSSKVNNVFKTTLKIPAIIQEYVVGKAWKEAFV